MKFGHPEEVTVLTAAKRTDRYSGEAVDAWDLSLGATQHPETCAVAPGGSTEPLAADRNAIDSDFDLIFDHEPQITSKNRVIVRGLTCDVDGHPIKWKNPFTDWEPGWVVRASIRED